MNRKVYHPLPKWSAPSRQVGISATLQLATESFTGIVEIDQWNIETLGKSLDEGVREVYEDEAYSILKKFNILKEVRPQGSVLEAGCGYGRWVKALHMEGVSIYGIDFAKLGIQELADELPNVPLTVGDVRELPFRDLAFDVILSFGVMEHAEEGPSRAIKEGFRCLKTGGCLVVSVPFLSLNRILNPMVVVRRFASSINLLRCLFRKGEKMFFQYEFSIGEFKSHLRDAGFKILFWQPIWVDFGIQDDFRCLSVLFYPLVKPLLHYSLIEPFIRYFFSGFIIFIAKK